MPTFIIFHGGQPIETIRGANPPALAAAITKAIALPDKVNAGSAFKTPGRTLGGEGVGAQGAAAANRSAGPALGFNLVSVFKHVIAVLGLYFVSIFAVRWYLFGPPPGGYKAMLTDWIPTIDRLLQPSPTIVFQHSQTTAPGT